MIRVCLLLCCGEVLAQAPVRVAVQAPAQSPTRPTVAGSVTVTATSPLPLTAPDRAARSFALDDPAVLPLLQTPLDLLVRDSSLVLNQRGPAGVQADLSLRGTTFEQTLVLLNGVRLNDPETGHFNFDPPVPLEVVARVDVLHGAGSTLFGSDAIGGAVNLVTAAPTYGSATLRLGGGSLGSTEQHLTLSGVRGRLAARLAGARDTSDGFVYATTASPAQNGRGFHSNALALDTFVTTARALPPTEILLGATDRPFGANLFYGNYDSTERTKNLFGSLRQPLTPRTSADFTFRRHTDLFVLRASDTRPNAYRNNHVDSQWQANLRRSDTLHPGVDLFYGLEADGDTIRSSSLGQHARNQGAGYASLNLRSLRRLTLSVGARQQIFAGPTPVFSPTAAAGYDLGHGLRARAAYGQGYRLPTYVDLYYSDPTTIGNPALRPETAHSYEGGVDVFAGTRFEAHATVFTLRQTDAIDYVKYTAAARYQAINVGQIAYTGAETSARWEPRTGQTVDFGYTFLHAAPPPADLISKYAYNYASHNGSIAWQGALPRGLRGFTARTQLAVVKRETVATSGGATQAPYALWDAAITRTRGLVRPYLRADNLTDTAYQELPGVPLPGRVLMGGVTLTWPASR